jgi:hypothetical protein
MSGVTSEESEFQTRKQGIGPKLKAAGWSVAAFNPVSSLVAYVVNLTLFHLFLMG